MKKEAALIVMALVWLLTRILGRLELSADAELVRQAAELIVMAGGALLIRFRVFSEATIRAAGFTPEEIQGWAENPAIPTAHD